MMKGTLCLKKGSVPFQNDLETTLGHCGLHLSYRKIAYEQEL